MPMNYSENEKIVCDFLGLWKTQNVDAMIGYFTEDATYIDIPLPPRHGVAEIRRYIEQVFSAFSVTIDTRHIVSAGDLVFTERVDVLRRNGSEASSVGLPVVGVMEMRAGKIAHWRDYFDLRTAEEGLGIKIRPD